MRLPLPRRHPGFAAGKDRDPEAALHCAGGLGPGPSLRDFRDDVYGEYNAPRGAARKVAL